MMERILIIGDVSRYFDDLFDSFSNYYEVHSCDFVFSSIKKSIRNIKPRLVLCVKPLSANIMTFQDIYSVFPDINLIVICEEGDNSMEEYPGRRLVVLQKPIKIKALREAMNSFVDKKVKIETIKYRFLVVESDRGFINELKKKSWKRL